VLESEILDASKPTPLGSLWNSASALDMAHAAPLVRSGVFSGLRRYYGNLFAAVARSAGQNAEGNLPSTAVKAAGYSLSGVA